ncbi:MAG: hypothetical protein DRP68_03510 [Candidatus Omnitrophota bacterium]|nr:MAG: hypothetical protein DRP68_03510 [Candidatus Omnitrophota bacterium]
MLTAILLIIIVVISRILPHFPNFSPLVAVALFSGVYIRKRYAFLIPLGVYIISDLIVGLHDVVIFTWSSILVIYFIGYFLKRRTFWSVFVWTIFSSILFFIITNLGVWIMGWYPRTFSGLIQCYTFAIPFFRTSLISDLMYVGVLFGVYELILRKFKAVLEKPVLL